jgi:hypothetical protein
MAERRAFFRADGDFLLMVRDPRAGGWVPHLPTMTAWRAAQLRIYMPDASTVVIMPGHDVWPVMSAEEMCDIRALVREPWIPDGTAHEGIPHDVIDVIDADVAAGHLDDICRPALMWDAHPLDLVFLQPEPSAPPPLPVVRPTPLPTARQPDGSAQTSSFALPSRLPTHVAALLIANAVATGGTCAITLSPITTDTAATTPCGHVFDREALATWIDTGHMTCPECNTQI